MVAGDAPDDGLDIELPDGGGEACLAALARGLDIVFSHGGRPEPDLAIYVSVADTVAIHLETVRELVHCIAAPGRPQSGSGRIESNR